MTTLGVIGSGNIGGTVAKLAVDAGYDVVVSNSRGPETLADLVAQLGPKARAATAVEAAEAGDLVLVSVPLKNVGALPVEPLAGKLVLDTCNYYPERDGQVHALDEKRTTTSRLVAEALPTSTVVKAFNNIYFKHLASMNRPAGDAERSPLMIAGDDDTAKATATAFLDAIGYDTFDAGSLDDSWRFERYMPAYVGVYVEGGDFSKAPTPPTAERITELLARGER